jgi:amino acid permease
MVCVCQMVDLKPFTEARMEKVAVHAMAISASIYLPIAVASYAIFGDDVKANVLNDFRVRRQTVEDPHPPPRGGGAFGS